MTDEQATKMMANIAALLSRKVEQSLRGLFTQPNRHQRRAAKHRRGKTQRP